LIRRTGRQKEMKKRKEEKINNDQKKIEDAMKEEKKMRVGPSFALNQYGEGERSGIPSPLRKKKGHRTARSKREKTTKVPKDRNVERTPKRPRGPQGRQPKIYISVLLLTKEKSGEARFDS